MNLELDLMTMTLDTLSYYVIKDSLFKSIYIVEFIISFFKQKI